MKYDVVKRFTTNGRKAIVVEMQDATDPDRSSWFCGYVTADEGTEMPSECSFEGPSKILGGYAIGFDYTPEAGETIWQAAEYAIAKCNTLANSLYN